MSVASGTGSCLALQQLIRVAVTDLTTAHSDCNIIILLTTVLFFSRCAPCAGSDKFCMFRC
jgi:hypothetical protein